MPDDFFTWVVGSIDGLIAGPPCALGWVVLGPRGTGANGQAKQNDDESWHRLTFCEKPKSDKRRVIVDLSFPENHAVNSGIASESYLSTPFMLTLPTIDTITSQVRKMGRGSLIFKVDVSRAFRHIKVDPGDYNLLGLKADGLLLTLVCRSA